MNHLSAVSRWCNRILEVGWCAVILIIPGFFNLSTSRHFEPDKALTLRAMVLFLASIALISLIEQFTTKNHRDTQKSPEWQKFMAISVIIYVVVYILTTLTSIAPYVSFFGSFQRLQGTYTNITYVLFGLILVTHIREREQIQRLISCLIIGSIPVVGYGWLQHDQRDPLPWSGDVITRVASTMGNSIFTAAYLIMVIPFIIVHMITSLNAAKKHINHNTSHELRWIIAYICFIAAGITVTYASLSFSAVVRASDERYWWVYPCSMIVSACLASPWLIKAHYLERRESSVMMPVFVLIGYVLIVGISFVFNQASGMQYIQESAHGGSSWPAWMIVAVLLGTSGAVLAVTTPVLAATSRRWHVMHGSGLLLYAITLILTIIFTQSRGPWIGGIAGLLALSTIAIVTIWRHDRRRQNPRALLWARILVVKGFTVVIAIVALLIFNLSDHPTIVAWRDIPYVGRMGRLLEVDQATGLVRRLIWTGDEHAGGAIGLIRSDLTRSIIGWGPETMFVVFSRHYPPSLATIEARGASPDRSHQLFLDELITRGVLGLASLLLVMLAAFRQGWRVMERADTHEQRLLAAAAMSAIIAHAVEGLSGIPIVATLLMFWIAIALIIVLARLPETAPAPEPPLPPEDAPAPPRRARRRARAPAEHAPAASSPTPRPTRLAGYAGIVVVTSLVSWQVNIAPMIADAVYQRAQSTIDRPSATMDQLIDGTSQLVTAISLDPRQDFYFLSLGRGLLAISAQRIAGEGLGTPSASAADLDALLQMTPFTLHTLLRQRDAVELLELAAMALERARELAPLNKDHYANLGRMFLFWYQQDDADQQLLIRAESWYRRGAEIAPQDVTILNEWAGVLLRLGRIDDADAVLQRSLLLDPTYLDTAVRRAELTRLRGDVDAAIDQYLAVIAREPHALDAQIIALARALGETHPAALARLRDGYVAALAVAPDDVRIHAIIGLLSDRAGDRERAAAAFRAIIERQPQNLEARRNLTLVLSGMLQYDAAYLEARQMLALATPERVNAAERAALDRLVEWLDGQRRTTP